jgi:hypothetical protein
MRNDEILKKLFTSNVRVRLLDLFVSNPENRIYIREAARRIGEGVRNVSRELSNLESVGFLRSERHGHQKYFFIDPDFLLLPELRGILIKTTVPSAKKGRTGIPNQLNKGGRRMPGAESENGRQSELYQRRWQILVDSRVVRRETISQAGESVRRLRRKIPGWSSVEEIRKWRDRFDESS